MSSPPPTAPSRRAFRHRFEGPELRHVLMEFVRRVPPAATRVVVPVATTVFYAAIPAARHAIEGNLEAVLGPASLIERHRRAFLLFVTYSHSIAYLYTLHAGGALPVHVRFVDLHHFDDVHREGQGVITVTGHVGAWQLMPYLMNRRNMPRVTMAMAEEPNRRLSEFEAKLRSQFNIVYTTGSPFVLLELQKVLRRGEVVGMQLDRQVGASLTLPFIGRPASFPLGAVMLARLSGRPIVPVFAVYPDGDLSRVEVHYERPITVAHTRDRERDVREALERTVALYERWVRRYPLQWFNFYDFWAPPRDGG